MGAPDRAELNLSRAVTLGSEESGRCREVETRVSVWAVRKKSAHCGEVAVKEGSTVCPKRLYRVVTKQLCPIESSERFYITFTAYIRARENSYMIISHIYTRGIRKYLIYKLAILFRIKYIIPFEKLQNFGILLLPKVDGIEFYLQGARGHTIFNDFVCFRKLRVLHYKLVRETPFTEETHSDTANVDDSQESHTIHTDKYQKKDGRCFFKLTLVESVLIFFSFTHPCSCLAFFLHFSGILQFQGAIRYFSQFCERLGKC